MPPGSVLLPSEDGYETEIVLKRRALVSGEMLTDARPAFDQQSDQPVVNFRFNGQGARRFGDATSQNVGKRFAIVLDNKVISAPVINEPITGGSGQISGNFTTESRQRAGAAAARRRPAGAAEGRGAAHGRRRTRRRRGARPAAISRWHRLPSPSCVFIILAYGLFGGFAAIALVVNGLLIVAHHVADPGDPDPARHRRPDPDPGRGGRRQRADL